MNVIEFKSLGLKFNIDPIAFEIFDIKIYWYGIIISIAFLIGFLVLMYHAGKYNYNKEMLLDLILITTPFAIIGARLYYVIFNFQEYKNDLWEVLNIRHGGLAIYGAIIASIIIIIIYCRYKKIKVLPILDISAPSFVIAQAIGRWGNFVNKEAYGVETDLPWAMTIIENGVVKNVHPTFLYESLWNLLVFIFLFYLFRHRRRIGEVFFFYVGLYSLGRFFIEGLRVDSLYFGSYRISQIVALIFVTISTIVLIKNRKKEYNENIKI